MSIKEEIKKAASEYTDVKTVEIATIKVGLLTVWINGKRFGRYDMNKHMFTGLFM